MEFDEVNLKPTYRILWGVPGFYSRNCICIRLNCSLFYYHVHYSCKKFVSLSLVREPVVIGVPLLLRYSLHHMFMLLNCDSKNVIYTAGRSNAINIAERLGLPGNVVENARELYGAASAGIDEVTYIAYMPPFLLLKNKKWNNNYI